MAEAVSTSPRTTTCAEAQWWLGCAGSSDRQEATLMRVNWEYCMLMQGESMGKRLGMGGGALVFRRFGLDGYVQNSRIGSADNEVLLAKTVALLGKNGWELVSVSAELQPGASFSGTRWVFKRPSGPVGAAEEEPTGPSETSIASSVGDSTPDTLATPKVANDADGASTEDPEDNFGLDEGAPE
jgi:hypothetical protein